MGAAVVDVNFYRIGMQRRIEGKEEPTIDPKSRRSFARIQQGNVIRPLRFCPESAYDSLMQDPLVERYMRAEGY